MLVLSPGQEALTPPEPNARTLAPVHWGMFALSRHTWYDPALRITALAEEHNLQLYIPKLGELVCESTSIIMAFNAGTAAHQLSREPDNVVVEKALQTLAGVYL